MFSLGRSVNINYPSNRMLVIFTSIIAIVMSIYFKDIVNGLFVSFGFFLCWALTREIDPAHDKSAFVSGALFIISSLFIFDGVQFLVLFYLLLSTRLISKICGKAPNLVDVASILLLSAYLSYSLSSPVFVLLVLLMSLLAWIRYNKKDLFKLATVVSIMLVMLFSFLTPWEFSDLIVAVVRKENILLIALTFILFISLIYFQLKTLSISESFEDDLGGKVKCKWLKLSTIYYSVAIIIITLFVSVSYSLLIILVSTVLGVNIYNLFKKITSVRK